MPNISLEEFDNPPEVGQDVTVKGKVMAIDDASGEVEISYDSVTVGNKEMKKEKPEMKEETLDGALNEAFGGEGNQE